MHNLLVSEIAMASHSRSTAVHLLAPECCCALGEVYEMPEA